MPLRKPDGTSDHGGAPVETMGGQQFPPEAYAYDSDITDHVVKRVQREADKILAQDEWVVVDGVGKQ
jgi:hypothetical protein